MKGARRHTGINVESSKTTQEGCGNSRSGVRHVEDRRGVSVAQRVCLVMHEMSMQRMQRGPADVYAGLEAEQAVFSQQWNSDQPAASQ